MRHDGGVSLEDGTFNWKHNDFPLLLAEGFASPEPRGPSQRSSLDDSVYGSALGDGGAGSR